LRKIERAGLDAKTHKGGKPIVAALTISESQGV
jgi:hypothetical protein